MNDKAHAGLPVKGYRPQTADNITIVNVNKALEERVLRQFDMLHGDPRFDQRWLALAKTNIEQGFMAMNRAVFRPERVDLPEDAVVAD